MNVAVLVFGFVVGGLGFAVRLGSLAGGLAVIPVIRGRLLVVALVIILGRFVPDGAVVALVAGIAVGAAFAMVGIAVAAAVFSVLAAVFAAVIVIPLGAKGVGRIVGAIVAAAAVVETVAGVVGLLTAVVVGGLNTIGPFGDGGETGTGGKDREAVLDAGAGPVQQTLEGAGQPGQREGAVAAIEARGGGVFN